MTASGWAIMILSVGTVTVLFVWCLVKVVTVPDETERIHGFEAKPPDRE